MLQIRDLTWFVVAACAELLGCFAFWSWARLGRPAWWLGWGVASLVVFAGALAQVETPFAGRAFAAYGGVYILAAIVWLLLVDRVQPDRWDFAGAALCLAGTMVILFARR